MKQQVSTNYYEKLCIHTVSLNMKETNLLKECKIVNLYSEFFIFFYQIYDAISVDKSSLSSSYYITANNINHRVKFSHWPGDPKSDRQMIDSIFFPTSALFLLVNSCR
jgi:hypothetical protein